MPQSLAEMPLYDRNVKAGRNATSMAEMPLFDRNVKTGRNATAKRRQATVEGGGPANVQGGVGPCANSKFGSNAKRSLAAAPKVSRSATVLFYGIPVTNLDIPVKV